MLPYSVTLSSTADVLQLEKRIRELLNCQTSTCAFLQSAEYMKLKFAITRSIQNQHQESESPEETIMHISERIIRVPNSTLFLCVSHDLATVILNSNDTVYVENLKRKSGCGKNKKQNDDNDEEDEEYSDDEEEQHQGKGCSSKRQRKGC